MLFFGNKNEEKSAIGIDIGTTSIKVVQLTKRKEGITVDTYGEVSLGPYAGKDVGQAAHIGDVKLEEAIKDLFREAKITMHEATIGIETNSAFITSVTMPLVGQDELRTMMPLEARRYIPIPMSEVQLDFWPVPGREGVSQTGTKTQEVVIAAVKNETLALYDRIAKMLELKKVELEIEGFSIIRACVPVSGSLLVIFDFGGEYSTLSLVRGGVVLDMHVIPRGSQDCTIQIARALVIPFKTAEEMKRKFGYEGTPESPFMKEVMELASYPLFGELARLIIQYERKYNQVIEGVIVTGGGARMKGLETMFAKVSHTPIRFTNPFESLIVPDYLQDVTATVGPTYTAAVGLALKKLA